MAKLNTIWEEKLHKIFQSKPKQDEELYLDIVSMFIYSNQNDDVSLIYKELGLDKFSSLLGLIGGKTIELPTQDELKFAMISALCFYYKDIKKQSWEEIHRLLPFNDVNAISYGISIAKLEKEIIEKIKNNFKDIDANNKDTIEELRGYL